MITDGHIDLTGASKLGDDVMCDDDDDGPSPQLDTSPRTSASSGSPPRYAVWRAESSAASIARSMALSDATTAFRAHAHVLDYTNTKMVILVGEAIVLCAPMIAERVHDANGLFAFIARTCPLNAQPQVRAEMREFVNNNVDRLLAELVDACGAEMLERRKQGDSLETRDVCSAAKMQHLTDTIDSLRLLSNLLLQRDRRTQSSINMLRSCRRTLYQQFVKNFDESLHTRPAPADSAEPACSICGVPYTHTPADAVDDDGSTIAERYSSEDMRLAAQNRQQRVVMNCCGNSVCVACITKHCANNSDFGCRSTATCIYCRAEMPLFRHLDKINSD